MGVKAEVVLVSSLFFAACSSHPASSGPGADGAVEGGAGADVAPAFEGGAAVDADPMTARGYCLGYLEVLAEFIANCDGVALADAQRLFVGEPPCDRFASSIAAGRVRFDGTHAAACVSALRGALTCNSSSMMPDVTACVGVVTPLVPVDGTCASFYVVGIGEECTDGAYCKEGPGYACTGVCTARVAVGGACDVLADVRCVQGATCDSASKKCVMPPAALAEGEPCGGAGQASCQRALYCDKGADGGTTGVCHARKTSGACQTDGDCVDTARCVGTTAKVCAAPKNDGDACTVGARECGIFSHCAGGICSGAGAAIGQPCGLVAGESLICVEGAYCDGQIFQAGTCVASKQPGDACTAEPLTQCDGNNGHCDTTTLKCVACAP